MPSMSGRWPEALVPVLYLATGALVVAILSRAEAVLMPLALATLLSFVLTPPAKALERAGLPRYAGVALLVLLTLGIVGSFGYVLSRQFNQVAAELPKYQREIRTKIAALRSSGGAITAIEDTVDKVSRDLDRQPKVQQETPAVQETAPPPKPEVAPVRVLPAEPSNIERFRDLAQTVLEPLTQAGIVLVLTVFMLLGREDLRNRVIRLVGRGRVTLTTRTLDEAADRISSFLWTQSIINMLFSAAITAGLFWIGLPYALLWGVAAGLLRFVPYVGAFVALLIPAGLAFVQFHGWGPTFATIGLFLSLDMVTANLIEPLVVGHRTGVPSIALLVSALFWTWLWGPVGLVVSTPLTVCLAVLGKHVPQLEFLAVLLEDAPALEPEVTYYQRLLAHDDDEASEIAEQSVRTTSRERAFDEILIPAMLWAARDLGREEISPFDRDFVLATTREIVSNVPPRPPDDKAPQPGEAAPPAPLPRPGRILAVPARAGADEVANDMLAQLIAVEPTSAATLASELLSRLETDPPDLVCVVALPPGGLNQARYICKRLRSRFAELPLLVVRPAFDIDFEKATRRLVESGADKVVARLAEVPAAATELIAAPRDEASRSRAVAGAA